MTILNSTECEVRRAEKKGEFEVLFNINNKYVYFTFKCDNEPEVDIPIRFKTPGLMLVASNLPDELMNGEILNDKTPFQMIQIENNSFTLEGLGECFLHVGEILPDKMKSLFIY